MVFTKLASLLALAGVVAADQWGLPTNQGTYLQNATFDGPNPTNVGYNIYVPPKVVKNAPLLVVAHWCTGSANDIYKYNQFPTYADKYGFVIIFPNSPNMADHCWDLSSKQTLTHNGGGDAQGIANMIQYSIKKYEADPSRVFMTGISSGGMMTEHMMGAYPNLFTAGAAIASVPFSCFADPNGGFATWSNACVQGKVTHTGAEWAKNVHDAYPSYTGYRPHLQLYHGTADQVVSYVNFGESIKEWTSVYGISETPVETDLDTPLTGWTKTVYGNGELQAFSCKDVPHDVPFRQDDIAAYFQLNCLPGDANCFRRPDHPTPEPTPVPSSGTPAPTTVTATPSPTPTTSAPSPTPTTSAPANGVPRWGQCGGNGYSGPTVCKEGACTKYNDWYSQCI